MKKRMILSFALIVLPLLTSSLLLVQCSTERKERVIWVGRGEEIGHESYVLVITSHGNVYVRKQEDGEKEYTWTKLCRLAERDDFVFVNRFVRRHGSTLVIGCEDGTIYYSQRGNAVLEEGEGCAGVVMLKPRLSFSAIK